MKKTILIAVVLFITAGSFVSCQSGDDKFPGFKETDDGMYYKFHTRGSDTTIAKIFLRL